MNTYTISFTDEEDKFLQVALASRSKFTSMADLIKADCRLIDVGRQELRDTIMDAATADDLAELKAKIDQRGN